MIQFTDKEKIEAFDKIAAHYYDKNFGTMSKADIDTLLFSEYIEHCLSRGLDYSDYALSKALGITQSRIRALKERKELKYPHRDFDWKVGLIEPLKTAKYDPKTHSVKILVQDVNVQIEFRNYVEQNGWYDDYSLNKKLSVIPIAGFVDIFGSNIDFNDEVKKKIEEICKQNPDNKAVEFKGLLKDFSKDSAKKFLMNASAEAIKILLSALPFGETAKPVVDILLRIVED